MTNHFGDDEQPHYLLCVRTIEFAVQKLNDLLAQGQAGRARRIERMLSITRAAWDNAKQEPTSLEGLLELAPSADGEAVAGAWSGETQETASAVVGEMIRLWASSARPRELPELRTAVSQKLDILKNVVFSCRKDDRKGNELKAAALAHLGKRQQEAERASLAASGEDVIAWAKARISQLKKVRSFLAPKVGFGEWVRAVEAFPDRLQGIPHGGTLSLRTTALYKNSLRTEVLESPGTGKLSWKPQATIQHPLEKSVALCQGLMGAGYELLGPLLQGFPDDEAFKNPKVRGLVFLQAYTMCEMAADTWNLTERPPTPKTDCELLTSLVDDIHTGSQIDVKGKLSFMSRRPFSEMLKDLKKRDPSIKYVKTFEDAMDRNALFKQLQVKDRFLLAGYASRLDINGGITVDSFDCPAEKKAEFAKFCADCKEPLRILWRWKMVTPLIFLRAGLWPVNNSGVQQTPARYYQSVVRTIEHPGLSMEEFVTKNEKIFVVHKSTDLLCSGFLDENSSFGQYNDRFFKKSEKAFDVSYGEALIEFRTIEHATIGGDKAFLKPSNFANDAKLLFEKVNELTSSSTQKIVVKK